jgi:DNA ligase-1
MTPMLMYQKNPDLDKLPYPIYVLPKLDGIRCLIKDGQAMSRSLKPIPNKWIQMHLKDLPDGLDGELIVGSPTAEDVYRTTNSFVMSNDKEGLFKYYVFDDWSSRLKYTQRQRALLATINELKEPILHYVPLRMAHNTSNLLWYEQQYVSEGYEGLILRNPDGLYKFGRTTLKENNGFKLKRFEDSEAIVVRILPEYENTNEAKRNDAGKLERSTSADGLVAKESMGAIVVYDPKLKVEFNIGTGFSAKDRLWWWEHGQEVIDQGRLIKYKYFPVGVKEKPRHPVFKGFRDKIDL